ncbi:hypothetical protein GNI_141100 [Gregarina niphandrodes]|uniref:Uncharacterized protein n=1 Tax=Gregarina niphandrodes TaxID=110365 RepID=A0A023B096_GRENI|nr:hypothetical protein GNI_141100 [Gregarina niphandrodes]EZG45075.1 hypothetical protein GNI_141100 [Gregarina niphandrodes]|eukprot:XP_011132579.1 hypothetical protein GNI_141100 [Gregarina niphandrodes]
MSTATLDMGGPKRLGSSVPDAPARMGSAKTGDGIPQQPLLSNDLTIKDPEVLSQGKSAAGAAAPGAGLPTGPGTSMTRPGPVVGPGSSMPGPGVPMTGPGAASMPAPALSFTGPGAASIAGRGAASMPGPTVSFTGPEQASMAGPGASVADPGAAVADPGAAVRSPETKQAGEAPGLNREESKLSLPPSTSIKEAHDEIGTRSRSFAKNATQPSDRQSIILPAVPGNQDLLRVESGRLTVMANASQVLCTLESAAYGVVADSQNLTLTLVLRENESPVHWYSFRILDRAAFESKCASLFSSGFTTDSGTGLETDGPSYAVAEAGSMALRGFAMQPAQTSVVTDAGRREIVVAEQLPERRVRKIKLACSEREFADWMRAFTWGGFTVDGKPRQALANPALGRFVFRIPVAVAAAKTTARFSKDGRLALFTNVDDPRPVFVIDKINSEVVADPSRQLLRCRLQPETAQAALVELTFSDQKAFDRVVDGASKNKLLKREFRQLPTAFTNKRMPVAMFRQNGFQLWPTARAYNEDEAPFVILFNRLFGAKLNEKEREVVFVPLAHVHPSLDDLAEIVKGFEFKLSATNLDYPRLVFGVVNIGMAGRRDADRPCTAAATFEFHGAARYAVHNQSVPMEGKVDYALLKRVSEANSRGMKIFASSGKKAAAKGAKGATKGGGSGRNRDSGGDNRASDRSPASSVPAKKVSAAAAPVSKKKASAKAAKGKPKPKPKTKKPKW